MLRDEVCLQGRRRTIESSTDNLLDLTGVEVNTRTEACHVESITWGESSNNLLIKKLGQKVADKVGYWRFQIIVLHVHDVNELKWLSLCLAGLEKFM